MKFKEDDFEDVVNIYQDPSALQISDIANAKLAESQILDALKEAKKIMVSARGDYSVRYQSASWLKKYGGLVE